MGGEQVSRRESRRMRVGRRAALAGAVATVVSVLVAAGGMGAAAHAQGEQALFAISQQRTGLIDLAFYGTPGTTVSFAEVEEDRLRPVGTATTGANRIGVVLEAEKWRCDRLVRTFLAGATAPDGSTSAHTFDIRTPSCANRIAVHAPRKAKPDRLVKVRLVDRWKLGDLTVDLCVSGADVSGRRCKKVDVPRRSRGVTRRYRPHDDGHMRVAVGVQGEKVVEYVAVGDARPRKRTRGPIVLATGDSTIQGVANVLADEAGSAARVRDESFPGTGLTTPGKTSWKEFAPRQVKRFDPDITVMSVGGNDGYPAGGVECCGPQWAAEYSRRVRALMRTYRRDGDARVLWLTLPIPRDPRRVDGARAINTAIVKAAEGLDDVRVLDLAEVFTPDGVFRETIRHDGRKVRVRADDGIHLSAAGTEIAGEVVLRELERAGWLDEDR